MNPREVLDLLDWKRRIGELYARIRSEGDPEDAWRLWRETRDALFRGHPQSPIRSSERAGFRGLDLHDYDPHFRALGTVASAPEAHYEIPTSGEGTMSFTRFGTVEFELAGRRLELEVYWLDAYGGGVFLPFRDATSGETTYGAGRYLLDTVKGADLGSDGDRLVLDFNFAYNPSCSYDARWVCPLAPPPNRLDASITAGERHSG